MNTIARRGLAMLLAALWIAPPVGALDYPLTSESIREAYFIGKENLDRRQEFFRAYRHPLPSPFRPDVHRIEVETPFAVAVEALSRTPLEYHSPDAVQDYLGKPWNVRVHVEIYLTATYPRPTDTPRSLARFSNTFEVHLRQRDEIAPLGIDGAPIWDDHTLLGYRGATIDVDYDIGKIDASEPLAVEVATPDGQRVQTTFAIQDLR